MKLKIIVILFIALLAISKTCAKEISTPFFSVNLPDEFIVEIGEGRLLAYGANGPYKKPHHFLAIEYDIDKKIEFLISNINETLADMEDASNMEEIECHSNCSAYIGTGVIVEKETGDTLNGVFCVIDGLNTNIVVTYGTEKDLMKAKKLVLQITKEISLGNI